MSKILFTSAQIKKLSKNVWIKNITEKAITYTDEFKIKLVKETKDSKKIAREIFEECDIEPDIIGMSRIYNSLKRWKNQYQKTAELRDTRKGASGRPRIIELSESEKLKRAEAKIKLLEAENELLKKNEMIELGLLKDIKSISNLN
jgi:transposase-like protein